MGRRYISVNVSEDQQEFMRLLDEQEITIFTIDAISGKIKKQFRNINEILENLVDKSLLSRIEKGKYCKPNFRDELAIGTFIARDGAIGYWSALHKHGLTELFSKQILVQSPHLKRDKSVFGVPYKFVKISSYKRVGIFKEGLGYNAYWMTDTEKTISDCFDLTQYAPSFEELIRSLNNAELDADKMIRYNKVIHNVAAIKRMGFLAEILEKRALSKFIQFSKSMVNSKYSILNPLGEDKGEFDSEWKLRLNIDRQTLLEIANRQY